MKSGGYLTVWLGLVAVLAMMAPAGAFAAGLSEAIVGAWSLDPELAAADARRGELSARYGATESLLPSPPAINLRHENDSIGRDIGQREFEGELELPVWLYGERGQQGRVIDLEAAKFEAGQQLRRLVLAGQVRDAQWAYLRQARLVTALGRQVGSAKTLSEAVAKQLKAGLASDADVLLARSELLAAESRLAQRRLDRDAAMQGFVLLAGIAPTEVADEPDVDSVIFDHHPRILAARFGIDVAQAVRALAIIQSRDNPVVGLRVRTERSDASEPYNAFVGVGVRIPLATDARNAPRIAKADADTVQASADYASERRRVELDYERARIACNGAAAQLAVIEQRRTLVDRQFTLTQKAFDAGQIGVTDLVIVRRSVDEARESEVEARVALAAARSQLRQAAGLIPDASNILAAAPQKDKAP